MESILFIVPINRTYVIMPHLGLGYLASVARESGYRPRILNCLKERMDFRDFERYIVENPADIFAITMMTYDINPTRKHIEIIRKHYPSSLIVLGGAHPSGDFLGILNDFPQADFAFRGEAELGFREFLEKIREGGSRADMGRVANLIWRDPAGKIVVNGWRVIHDLDTISFPAWDLMDPRTYPEAPHGGFARNFPVAPIIITRGCPFKCTFCSGKSVTGTLVRKRSIANVMEELRYLAEDFGVREVHVEDENFTLHRRLVMEFCDSLMESGLGLTWACPSGIRLDNLDTEMLDAMSRSGCHSLAVGVEFGSDRIHALTRKGLTVDVIREKLALLARYDIKVTGFFLMGIPGETREEMLMTMRLARELPIHRAQFNNFMPLPGTEIYDRLKEEGKLDGLPTDHFFVHDVSYVPEGMTRRQLKNLQRRAYLRFYLRPRVAFRVMRDIETPRQLFYLAKRFMDAMD
ncbi:MAG: radical SAM protein [Actinobacteria bacterium]|nr:radical SAM protein [Actinomycetota bacterium]